LQPRDFLDTTITPELRRTALDPAIEALDLYILPPWKPIFPLILPQRWAVAASATIMRRASEPLRVIAKHLLDGSDSGSQTEALKGASTSCQAVSRLGTSASDEGVVTVVMALLSFAESAPRA
jgi:hypothetical protein